MPKFAIKQSIQSPVEDVFAFMDEFKNDTLWRTAEMHKISDGPAGIGQTYVEVRTIMGKQLEGPVIITEYAPNQNFTFERTSGPIRPRGTYLFESITLGTKLTLILDVPLRGGWKLATPLVALLLTIVKRGAAKELARLKQVLEVPNL